MKFSAHNLRYIGSFLHGEVSHAFHEFDEKVLFVSTKHSCEEEKFEEHFDSWTSSRNIIDCLVSDDTS